MIIGIISALILPGTPMTARFLSEAERVALIKHVSVNQTGIENKFRIAHVREILLDLQIWLLSLNTILVRRICLLDGTHADYLDLNLQWGRDNVLDDSDQEHWLPTANHHPSQYAVRNRVNCQHFDRWVRRTLHFEPMGMDSRLLRPWHLGRRSYVFCTQNQQNRYPSRNLPRQRHHSSPDHHLLMDSNQYRRADQARGQHFSYRRELQCWEYYRTSDVPSQRCTTIHSCEDRCVGDAGGSGVDDCGACPVLRLGKPAKSSC